MFTNPKRALRALGLLGLGLPILALVAACGSSSSSTSTASSAAAAASTCKPRYQFHTMTPGVLTVAAAQEPPIFEYTQGQPPTGIEGEVLDTFAKQNCLKLNVVISGAAAGVIPAVQAQRADMGAGGWYITPQREKVVDFSVPEYLDSLTIISRQGYNSMDQLKGKTIGTVLGYLFVDRLQQLYGANNVKLFQTEDGEFSDLFDGRVDAVIEGLVVASTDLKKSGKASEFKVEPIQPTSSFVFSEQPGKPGFPVAKSNPQLRDALSGTLNSLRASGTLGNILTQYGISAGAANISRG
jgi:polar amino acid transport system substrate-binding protein